MSQFSLWWRLQSRARQPTITRPDGRNMTPAQIDSTVNRLIQAVHVTGAGVALFPADGQRPDCNYRDGRKPIQHENTPPA